jgi:hypothetical protein
MSVSSAAQSIDVGSGARHRDAARFGAFAALFVAIYLFSWPTLFSFDLWVLKDRGSFLNLDNLLAQHLRLGVDAFYSYGLLPVLVQHWLFRFFGAGYRPLIGCAVVTLLLIAYFCALLLRYLPQNLIWLIALIAMGRILNIVNPNLPYSLVQISILFAILFVLAGRFEIALAVASIGCWCVPSLPLVLSASIVAVIVVDWFFQPSRSLGMLVVRLVPGALAYATIGLVLALQFGLRSVAATATPLSGMSYYHQAGYGSRQALLEFLHPTGFDRFHYLLHVFLNPVAWWVFSSVLLLWLAFRALLRIFAARELEPRAVAIILCAIVQFALATVAYGAPHQHFLYDPVLIVGVLLGLADIQTRSAQKLLLMVFLVLGVVGQASLLRSTLHARKQVRSADTAQLYADREWASEWKPILTLAQQHNLLMFSYSTGVHHYFPSIHSPDVWFVLHGQFLPTDISRVNRQIDQAEVVVLDMTSPIDFDFLKPGSALASSFCMIRSTPNFQIWWRRSTLPAGTSCMASGSPSPSSASTQM